MEECEGKDRERRMGKFKRIEKEEREKQEERKESMRDVEGTKEKFRVVERETVSRLPEATRKGKKDTLIRGRRIRDEEMRKKDDSGRERKCDEKAISKRKEGDVLKVCDMGRK